MDYLQLPILLQLSSAGEGFQMQIQAGYAFGYLLHYTYDFPKEIRVVDQQNATTLLLKMPERFGKTDHSLVAGVMASIPVDFKRLQLGLRANIGKANFAEGETAFEAHNLTVGLLLGMEF
jgi:hypothetical protein